MQQTQKTLHPGNFAVLDATLAAGFGKVLHGEFGRSINVLEEKAVLRQAMLGGRQIAWHVYQHKQWNVKAQFLSLKTS